MRYDLFVRQLQLLKNDYGLRAYAKKHIDQIWKEFSCVSDEDFIEAIKRLLLADLNHAWVPGVVEIEQMLDIIQKSKGEIKTDSRPRVSHEELSRGIGDILKTKFS